MSIEKILGMPELASAHGYEIDFMIFIVHVFMLILFVGWGVFFFYCLFKFNHWANPKADYHGVQSHRSTYLEAIVVVIEVILLVGFSIPFWIKQVNNYPDRKDVVELRINAEQFAWNVHYPGLDGIFGKTDVQFFDKQSNPMGLDPNDPNGKDDFTAINQLHIPIGKPAIIHLTSRDVVHSFFIPQMRARQDTIPGMSIPVWFTPIKTGKYEIACAQLCGLGHYRMKGFVTVESQEDFDKWYASQSSAASAEASGGGGDDFWN